jgi:4-hydroxy-tetrahydrodipicolinate synthase
MASATSSAGWLAGYISDLPTPFDESGEIDWAAFAKICERQIEAGASAIVVAETAGEASNLTTTEHDAIVRAAVRIARGRTRVIAGAGSNSTGQAIELATRAEQAGADAVLSVVPYYNRPMQEGIRAHFQAVAGATGLPIILHDVPSRTSRELADDTLARLAESKQFVGLRDGTGDITRPMCLRSLLPPEFRLLSGEAATGLAFLANGGDGFISMISNVAPGLCQAIYSSCRQGRLQSARYLFNRLVRLTSCLAKESPAALKFAMCLLGFMHPNTRLPIVELAESAKAEIASALAEIGDEDLACASESWRGPRFRDDPVAVFHRQLR